MLSPLHHARLLSSTPLIIAPRRSLLLLLGAAIRPPKRLGGAVDADAPVMMIGPSSSLLMGLYALFAASAGGGPSSRNEHIGRSSSRVGRGRYSPSSSSGGGRGGDDRRRRGRRGGQGGRGGDDSVGGKSKRPASSISKSAVAPYVPPPPLTTPNSLRRPWYLTCRHTYENVLKEEISRAVSSHTLGGNDAIAKLSLTDPHPGLVCLQHEDIDLESLLPDSFDPIYALQSMPNCVVVQAESIKGLAGEVMDAVLHNDNDERAAMHKEQLMGAPRGSLSVHALVPEMFRGVPRPMLQRRATKVAEVVADGLKMICPAARPPTRIRVADDNGQPNKDVADQKEEERWVLQILLLEPEFAAASLTRCRQTQDTTTTEGISSSSTSSWPNWSVPAGLALVDIEQTMPSSAYRKLLEAFWCMGDRPPAFAADNANDEGGVFPVVDLGACPGGWTAALRLMGCSVVAVDRSPLDEALMEDPMIDFVEGDAFRFAPPWVAGEENNVPVIAPPPDSWMVSDIIAYPERICELLDLWCGNQRASRVVVTVKFQGNDVPWTDLDKAMAAVKGHGYSCRIKHFFNNKNEVTLMATSRSVTKGFSGPLLGRPMFPTVLPRSKNNKK